MNMMASNVIAPPPPRTLAEVGLNTVMMRDILLKTMFRTNMDTATGLSKLVALPLTLTQELIDLCRGQRLVEIIADQHDLDRVAAENAGLVDFLARRGDGHEDGATGAEMATGKGHALGMVASAGTDEMPGCTARDLAHGVEGAAQLVAAHRGQIFAFQPDFGAVFRRKVVILLKRGRLEEVAQRDLCLPDRGGKVFHAPRMARISVLGKGQLNTSALSSSVSGKR